MAALAVYDLPERELDIPLIDIAAALVSLAQGDTPLLLNPSRDEPGAGFQGPARGFGPPEGAGAGPYRKSGSAGSTAPKGGHKAAHKAAPYERQPPDDAGAGGAGESRDEAPPAADRAEKPNRGKAPRVRDDAAAGEFGESPRGKLARATSAMETYRIEVGHVHQVKPGNIVGAIANESGIDGVYIGRVDIREDHSFVDLPEGMPKKIFKDLQKVRIGGRELRISHVAEKPPKPRRDPAGRHEKLKIRT